MEDGTVRTEVTGAVLYHPTGQKHPRERLASHAYPRIGLGILEKYIVAGLILLDEVVLKQEGIRFTVNYGVTRIRNLADQHPGLGVEPVGRDKVLRNSLVQVLRLTHIYDISLGVIIPVDSGGMWK